MLDHAQLKQLGDQIRRTRVAVAIPRSQAGANLAPDLTDKHAQLLLVRTAQHRLEEGSSTSSTGSTSRKWQVASGKWREVSGEW